PEALVRLLQDRVDANRNPPAQPAPRLSQLSAWVAHLPEEDAEGAPLLADVAVVGADSGADLLDGSAARRDHLGDGRVDGRDDLAVGVVHEGEVQPLLGAE